MRRRKRWTQHIAAATEHERGAMHRAVGDASLTKAPDASSRRTFLSTFACLFGYCAATLGVFCRSPFDGRPLGVATS